jgi:hypothetical protein
LYVQTIGKIFIFPLFFEQRKQFSTIKTNHLVQYVLEIGWDFYGDRKSCKLYDFEYHHDLLSIHNIHEEDTDQNDIKNGNISL